MVWGRGGGAGGGGEREGELGEVREEEEGGRGGGREEGRGLGREGAVSDCRPLADKMQEIFVSKTLSETDETRQRGGVDERPSRVRHLARPADAGC